MVNFCNNDKVKPIADAVCSSQIELFGTDPGYGFEANTSNSKADNKLIG
jgi:hypothetical protein